ncbi:MAG: CehA/McbA family metallohydrolase [Planctomycetota bacterium]|jgi:hypothetical protein
MARKRKSAGKKSGASFREVSLARRFNWPRGRLAGAWKKIADEVRRWPSGRERPWGVPFRMAGARGPRVLMAAAGRPETVVPVGARADYLCFLHSWEQLPEEVNWPDPTEGLVVGEYELRYADGSSHVQPVRARFETMMIESPAICWLARPYEMWEAVAPEGPPPAGMSWGRTQTGVRGSRVKPLVYAMPNPYPGKKIVSLVVRGLRKSPLLVAGLTLFRGKSHPLRHLPRRTYRVKAGKRPARVAGADADLGGVVRVEHTSSPRDAAWLKSPYAGLRTAEPDRGEDLVEAFGAEDASLSVKLEGRERPLEFSLGEAYARGRSRSGGASLEVLGRRRQWMTVRVVDASTGRPTPVRAHFSGSRGEYLAPYGHHSQVNANWFEDYGADVQWGGRNYAYVPGEFTTDVPVGDVYYEIFKGFEYRPARGRVRVRPGQKKLEIRIRRWKDLRSAGWVTADTHVHFISPHTAWLEGQAEGVNVVNLLASQWGRLFTNVGDITGKVGVVEDDTIVYVGTENRNHMLGHMSMLGTRGLPVYPMCCGQPGEAFIDDPEFMTLAEWAMENRRKGGLVIRPHYPYCGHTEDPVPILKGLVDALEINPIRAGGFPVQEWYRYLNCGYRVSVCGGTDKMGAYTALGWLRTYALLEKGRRFDYANWCRAVRAGRTFTTNGPVMDMSVEGKGIGSSIRLPRTGGKVEVRASAECYSPLGRIEIVQDGRVVASESSRRGSLRLRVRARLPVTSSGWIAARCYGPGKSPGDYLAAHTSPVYVKVGRTRAFDGPAAEHMLALVEGGIEYLNTLATHFDERSRRRMVRLFREARAELRGRLLVEGGGHHHDHGEGPYHTHGHGHSANHTH